MISKIFSAQVSLLKATIIEVEADIGKGIKSFTVVGLPDKAIDEAKDRIRLLGGDISSSVGKAVDYVVIGSEPGEKYDKAKKLGVKIIDEKTFLSLIK